MKVIKCNLCGNQLEFLYDSTVVPVCCGQKMEEVVANTVDASKEKHVPVVKVSGNSVSVEVGSVLHPMLEEHYITYIVLETNLGLHKRVLNPGEQPTASFEMVQGEKAVAVYEYCNLHGLWKTVI